MVCRVKKTKVGIKVKEKEGKEREGERISGKIEGNDREGEERERGERGIQTYTDMGRGEREAYRHIQTYTYTDIHVYCGEYLRIYVSYEILY